MNTNTGIDESIQQKIIAIINAIIPDAAIYLFGSRARGTHLRWSDIDIALEKENKIDFVLVGEINSLFEASNIMQKIQVLDINAVSKEMRENIINDRIIWKK